MSKKYLGLTGGWSYDSTYARWSRPATSWNNIPLVEEYKRTPSLKCWEVGGVVAIGLVFAVMLWFGITA